MILSVCVFRVISIDNSFICLLFKVVVAAFTVLVAPILIMVSSVVKDSVKVELVPRLLLVTAIMPQVTFIQECRHSAIC